MNEQTVQRIYQLPCWQQSVEVQPLSGGMTNLNYKVTDGPRQFVVRLGEDKPEHLLWRNNEGVTSEVAAACGFSPRVILREQGLLVIQFIEGRVLTEADVREPSTMQRIIPLLHRFHYEMPLRFDGYPIIFWVFQVLRHYANMLRNANSPYCERIPELAEIASQLEQDVGPVNIAFGHNDLLAANFIDDGEKIWMIDFDYAGFNSPLFDLANLGSNNEFEDSTERLMLELYYSEPPCEARWKSYNAMKCASLLRETMWSMVSESYSKIEFDYSSYTQENDRRFSLAYSNYLNNLS